MWSLSLSSEGQQIITCLILVEPVRIKSSSMAKIMDVRNSSEERDGFWEAYRGCAEENRVRPDRSGFYPPTQKTTGLPVDECVCLGWIMRAPKYECFGGFRHWRITLRSLGVGGYFM